MQKNMQRTVALECLKRRMRMAMIEDGEICEYSVAYDGNEQTIKDNVYLGRVVSVVRATQSAFVDIGLEKNAIVCATAEDKSIRPGELILVQVQKEPPAAEKGPRVTRNIQISGRLCVLCTEHEGIGVSQKITQEQRRTALLQSARQACLPGMGIIVRTQAENASPEALQDEIKALCQAWKAIQERARGMTRPGLLYAAGGLMERLVRDVLDMHRTAVICDDARICDQIRAQAPYAGEQVTYYTGKMPLFDMLQIEGKLKRLLERRVLLKSGASLVIDACEAMTVIDVNSAGNTQAKNGEETAFSVNMEATKEIARQLRLRDIGGIIVVDFIDMARREHRDAVLEALEEAVKADRSRVQIGGLSPLTLCEMTRKTLTHELRETLGEQCRHCGGTGKKRTDRERAYEVLTELRRRAYANGPDGVYLLQADARCIQALAGLGEHFPCAAFYAKAGKPGPFSLKQIPYGEDTASYQRIDGEGEKQ